jgi:hypothetical protein
MWIVGVRAFDAMPFRGEVWRLVEDQAAVATMRVVDTLAEQQLLEQAIEMTKPAVPEECAGLHYLLATPFRYRPYPSGSRFRRAGQAEGGLVAADLVGTAVAEMAFHRTLFIAEAPGMHLPRLPVSQTAFSVRIKTDRMIDLSTEPLNVEESKWVHPSAYDVCQDLADEARRQAIELIRYRSVRTPVSAMNAAILVPAAFADSKPRQMQTWYILIRKTMVEAWCEFPPQTQQSIFSDWRKIDARIPDEMALGRQG